MRKLLILAIATAPLAAQAPQVRLIAAPEAQSKPLFGVVPYVRALPGGKLLVNDIQRRQLTLLDQTLGTATVIADSASGTANSYGVAPGGLIPYLADSTLFVDPAGLSMFVIDPAGKTARIASVPRSQDARSLTNGAGVPGLDAKGRLVYRSGLMMIRPARGRDGVAGPGGLPIPEIPDSSVIVRIDLATRKVDTAGWVKIPKVKMNIVRTDNGVSLSSEVNPLPTVDDFAVLSNGAIAVVRGQDYHVDIIDADGRVTNGGKIPFDWQRLTDDDKVAVIDSAKKAMEAVQAAMAKGGTNPLAGMFGGAGGGRVQINMSTGGDAGGPPRIGMDSKGPTAPEFISASELPDYRPAITQGAARADADGNLWVRTTSVRAGSGVTGPIYDVINSRGELIDRIQIPAGRQIVGFAKGGVVYMVARDQSGSWIERTHR